MECLPHLGAFKVFSIVSLSSCSKTSESSSLMSLAMKPDTHSLGNPHRRRLVASWCQSDWPQHTGVRQGYPESALPMRFVLANSLKFVIASAHPNLTGGNAYMHAFNYMAPVRTHRRSLLSVFALLTICLVAALPISLQASSWTGGGKKIPTTTKLKASATTVKENQRFTITVAVTPSKATGKVSLFIKTPSGSTEFGGSTTLRNGRVTGSGSLPKVGKYKFKIVYSGSSTYASSTSNIVTITVQK
jgi:hypothetical protein